MKLIKLILQYLTNSKFRNQVDVAMSLANGKNILPDTDKQIQQLKSEMKANLSKRISELNDLTTIVRSVPGSSFVLTKLNQLMSGLKQDLKNLD